MDECWKCQPVSNESILFPNISIHVFKRFANYMQKDIIQKKNGQLNQHKVLNSCPIGKDLFIFFFDFMIFDKLLFSERQCKTDFIETLRTLIMSKFNIFLLILISFRFRSFTRIITIARTLKTLYEELCSTLG